MRSEINKTSYVGKLQMQNAVYENVKCEIEKDEYSNKNIKCEFDVYGDYELLNKFEKSLSQSRNDETKINYFAISGKGNLILEATENHSSVSLNQFPVHTKIKGTVNKYTYKERYSTEEPDELIIRFKIPYLSIFGRNLNQGIRDKNTAMVYKYYKEIFKLFIDESDIEFLEEIREKSESSITFVLQKFIVPKISKFGNFKNNINQMVESLTLLMREVLIIISFLQNKRVGVQGYKYYTYKNNKLIDEVDFIDSVYYCGNEYVIEHVEFSFRKLFNPYYLSRIVEKYRASEKKEEITNLIYKLLTVTENSIFEVFITEAAILLESAARLVVGNEIRGYEKVIKKALEELGLINEPKFKIDHQSPNNWLITKHRNNFVHSKNEDYVESVKELWDDYNEIIRIVRLIILKILDKNFIEFPLPEN